MTCRILVIRLGALGDFVQSFPAFQAIRRHYPDARITLLTTKPFCELARLSPWFDATETDTRPALTDLKGMQRLRRQLSGYDLIFDLQTSGRSSRYRRFAGGADWSGIARGASLPHASPWRNEMHTRARQRDQLRMAGIPDVSDADISWLRAVPVERLVPDTPWALLVPGAAPHRPGKRWPAENYAALAQIMVRQGLTPVIAGTAADHEVARLITDRCPQARDLTGKTSLPQLAALCARASLAVGNDTGPMHLAAIMGCPALTLFSRESDPALTAPLGRTPGQVRVLRVNDIATLSVDRVVSALGWRH